MDAKCRIISSDDIYEKSKRLAEKIKNSGFSPDVIVALARGGWIPARYLCDFLGVKELVSLRVEHWGITAQPDGKAVLKHPINIDLKNKKILIVDDVADTGESLVLAREYIKTLGPNEVKTATMQTFHSTPKDRFPDIYVEKIPWEWLVYPWSFFEDLINLTEKVIDSKEMDLKEIQKKLKDMGLDIDLKKLDEILIESERRGKLNKKVNGEQILWFKV